MRGSKQLIIGTIGLIGVGAVRDIAYIDDQYTVPRVPLTMTMALSTATDASLSAHGYTANMITGDVYDYPRASIERSRLRNPIPPISTSHIWLGCRVVLERQLVEMSI